MILLMGLGWAVPLSAEVISLTPDLNPYIDGTVRVLATQSDNKILVGGDLPQGSHFPWKAFLGRVTATGEMDNDFHPSLNGAVTHLALMADGKIIAVGEFTSVGGSPASGIVRLNQNGTRDSSFLTGTSQLPGPVSALLVKPDGKILVAGTTSAESYWLKQLQSNGTTDTSFAATINGQVATLALEMDGRVLLGGSFSTVNGVSRTRLARIEANGILNTAFAPSVDGAVSCLRIQPDGKILIAGSFTQIAGDSRSGIARLAANGVLDNQFSCSVDGAINCIKLQANGKILIGGDFDDDVRLLYENGDTDSTYSLDPSVSVHALTLEQDGRLLIGGSYSSSIEGYLRRAEASTAPVIELTSPASNELKLVRGGSVAEVRSVVFDQWDGDAWIVLGAAVRTSAGWTRGGLTLPAGAWYRARSTDGETGLSETVVAIGDVSNLSIINHDGSSLTEGDSVDFGSVDWLGSGSPITVTVTNTGTGPLTNLGISLIGIHPEVFVLTGPETTALAPGASATFTLQFVPQGGGPRRATLRVTSSDNDNHTLDITLNGVGIQQDADFQPVFNNLVHVIAVEPGGNVLAGGRFTQANGQSRSYLARFDTSGNLDSSFAPTLAGWVYDLKCLPDGKVLVRCSDGGSPLVRLHADGSIDTGFGAPPGMSVSAIDVLPDGKLLLITSVLNDLGNPCAQVVRLNANGDIDETFNRTATSSEAYDSYSNVIALQDGKILVIGSFAQIQGVSRRSLVRFHVDGQVDTTFANNPGISSVDSAAVQADGKILLAGYVKNINFQSVRGLIRLERNGVLDAGFNPLDYHGKILALQADGRVLMSGEWLENIGYAMQRLNGDGSMDTAFHLGSQGSVDQAVLTSDGKILACGSFTELGGVSRSRLGRVPNNIVATHSLSMPTASEILWQRGGSAPDVRYSRFERWNGTDWTSVGAGQRVTGGWRLTDVDVGQAGYIRACGESSGHINGRSAGILVTDQAFYNFTGAELTAVQLWRIDHFGHPDNVGDAANDNDFDQDGASNLLEYAFGTDPLQCANLPRPALVANAIGGVSHLTVNWTRAGTPAGVLCVPEFSENLQDWESDSDRISVLVDLPELLSLRMTTSPGRAFLRIRVIEE